MQARRMILSREKNWTLAFALSATMVWPSLMMAAPKAKPAAKPATAKPRPSTKPNSKPAAQPAIRVAPAPAVAQTPAPTPTPEVGPKTFALLVGVGNYQNPSISDLRYPATDAAGIQKALTDPQIGGLPADRVFMLTDEQATRNNILNAVDKYLKPRVQAGDHVLVFLAGHGVAKGVGSEAKSYLLPTDMRGLKKEDFEVSAVDLKVLSARLGELPASQFVLFVDACREDPTPGRGVKGNLLSDVMARSVQVTPTDRTAESATLFACSLGQRAFEDPRLGHGVFTYHILQGLKDKALPKPNGIVDMGLLAHYVTEKVQQWAEKTSRSGDFEVEQTPEIVTGELRDGVQVIRVRNAAASSAATPAVPTRLRVVSMPEGAQVTINGKRVGAAPVLQTYPGGDEFKVRVEMAGYEPAERTVKLLNGYGHQIRVPLMAARSVGAVSPAANMANDMFQKGQDAESRQQWEVAEMAYNTVLGGDAKFAPAYQRLAEMHMQRGNYPKAIETLIKMTNQVPSTHSWSMLSRAYASFAMQAKAEAVTEKKGKKPARVDVRTFRNPRNGDEAAAFAVEAAKRALQMGGSTTEANLSAGFASIAADAGGKNKPEAMNYLSKAVVLDDRDANVHFGQGFAMRYFAPFLAVAAQKAELQRARKSLEKAVDLRPDFYEAHRELGYCAQMLDDNPAALKHYQIASSLRGSTEDGDDVAGVDVAMSTIHKEEAQKTTDPEKKAEHEAASEGYITDAKDNSKTGNLTNVMKRLVFNGMGGSMRDFLSDALPPGVRQAMDIANDPRAALENEKNRQIDKVTDGITGKIGGIFGR